MTVKVVTRQEVEEFLYQEAELLNEEHFNEWLDLFANDGNYWIPCNETDLDPNRHVSIIYDDRARLEERVWRLQTGIAYGQEPKSKTRHLISNVKINEYLENMLVVSSNFLVTELRRGKQTIYTGKNIHQLRLEHSSWKIVQKKVELINLNEPMGNLSFLL